MEDAGVTLLFRYKHEINRQTHHIDQLRWGMPPCWRQRVCCACRACRQMSTAVLDPDMLSELCSTSDGDLLQSALCCVSPPPPAQKVHYLQHHCVHQHISQYYASNVTSSQYKDQSLGCIKCGFTSMKKRDIYNIISILNPAFN